MVHTRWESTTADGCKTAAVALQLALQITLSSSGMSRTPRRLLKKTRLSCTTSQRRRASRSWAWRKHQMVEAWHALRWEETSPSSLISLLNLACIQLSGPNATIILSRTSAISAVTLLLLPKVAFTHLIQLMHNAVFLTFVRFPQNKRYCSCNQTTTRSMLSRLTNSL